MKQEDQDYIDRINQQELKEFLRICTFGNMGIDATTLNSEQQQHLFDILQRLHKSSGLDVRGIWGIISLAFKNRSGLVLMTMYHNSNVQTSEILYKKGFLKDIQTLENPNLTITTLRKILQIINIDCNYFCQKFKQWQQEIKNAQRICSTSPVFIMSENKIYEEDQYDSEPDTKYYMDLREIEEEETIFRRFSLFINPSQLKQLNDELQMDQDTITLTNPKRKYQQPSRRQQRRKKRSKRPDPKRKKTRLMKQMKNKEIDIIKFVKNKKERTNLRGTYNLIRNMREQGALTPQRFHNVEQNVQQVPPRRYTTAQRSRRRRSYRAKRNQHDMDIESERQQSNYERQSNESSSLINDDSQGQLQIQQFPRRHFISSQSESNEQTHQVHHRKRLKRQRQFEYRINQQSRDGHYGDDNENINESIQNLQIKRIKFPNDYEQLLKLNLISQSDHCYFNIESWNEYMNAMNDKEKYIKIKSMINKKDSLQLESIYSLFAILSNPDMRYFIKGYINPLLQYKLIKILSNIINQIINILYTSTYENDVTAIFQACKLLMVVGYNSINQQIIGKQNFISSIFNSLNNITQGIYIKQISTDSMIQLPRAFDVVKSSIRIKLPEDDLKESVLITLEILAHGFLKHLFELEDDSKYIKNFNDQFYKCYQHAIKTKTRFLRSISEIYTKFELSLTTKQQFSSLLLLLTKINLNESQPEYISEIMPGFTRNFISQKIKKDLTINGSFNYKPMLNYILTNEFMQQCKTIQGQLANQIILQTYQVLMQFKQFHYEMTINSIINFIKGIDFSQKFNQSFLIIILRLLVKCYTIKINKIENKFNYIPNNKDLQVLEVEIERYFQSFCRIYENLTKIQSKQSLQKSKKFQNILQSFIQQFIQNEQISTEINHYIFTLRIMTSYLVPLISKPLKQNEFNTTLAQCFIDKIGYICEIAKKIHNQIMNQPIGVNQLDEIEQEEILYERKLNADKYVKEFFNSVKSIAIPTNLIERIQKQCLSFTQMKLPHQKDFYTIQGMLTALCLFQHSNLIKIRGNAFKCFDNHVKEIKILKPENFFKWSNKMMFQFLKGFLKTVKIFAGETDIERRVEEAGNLLRESIYDILLLNFICQKQKEQLKNILQIVRQTYKISCFKQTEHLLTKFPIVIRQQRGEKVFPDLKAYYNMVIDTKIKQKVPIKNPILFKFKHPYFETLINLYKQYEELRWNIQRTNLGLNILNTFIFLMKVDAAQDVLKTYREHFIMNHSQVPRDKQIFQANILRGIDLSKESNSFAARSIIELFKLAYYEKKNEKLCTTRNYYFQYIVNLTLMGPDQNKDSVEYKFTRIKCFIEALHDQCQISEINCQNRTSFKSVVDYFSITTCEYLLDNFLSKSFLVDNIKNSCVSFFLSLFKNYPKLNEAYMMVLKNHYEKIDKIIKSKRSLELTFCDNLQDAIRKYVINQNFDFDFEKLYDILNARAVSGLRRDRNGLKQLKQITMKCLTLLQGKHIPQSNQIFKKYKRLLQVIEQSEELCRNRFSLEQLMYGSVPSSYNE